MQTVSGKPDGLESLLGVSFARVLTNHCGFLLEAVGIVLKGHYDATRVLGAKAISSDFEQSWLKCKQFPWPQTSPAGEIEVPMPRSRLPPGPG